MNKLIRYPIRVKLADNPVDKHNSITAANIMKSIYNVIHRSSLNKVFDFNIVLASLEILY